MKRVILLTVLALLAAISVLAEDSVDDNGNPNDPAINEKANACYDGAAWEGKCGADEYLWEAGWYFIRLDEGVYTVEQIPAEFSWIIAPEGTAVVVEGHSSHATNPMCKPFYRFEGTYYVLFSNPAGDVVSSGAPYWTGDASCSGPSQTLNGWKIAYAPQGQTQADALCGNVAKPFGNGVYIC